MMKERVGTMINMQDAAQREAFLLIVLKKDLSLQRHGIFTKPRASTIARKRFGFKGNLNRLIIQVEDLIRWHHERGTRFGFDSTP